MLETVPTITGTSIQSITWCDLYKTHHCCPDTRPGTGVSACSGNRVGEWQSTDPGVPALSCCWEQLEKDPVSSEQTTEATNWIHYNPYRQELPLSDASYKSELLQKWKALGEKARTPVPLLNQNIDCNHPSPTYQDLTLERMKTALRQYNVQSWVHAVCRNNPHFPMSALRERENRWTQWVPTLHFGLWGSSIAVWGLNPLSVSELAPSLMFY